MKAEWVGPTNPIDGSSKWTIVSGTVSIERYPRGCEIYALAAHRLSLCVLRVRKAATKSGRPMAFNLPLTLAII